MRSMGMDCHVASRLAMTLSGYSKCIVQNDLNDNTGLQTGKKHDSDFDGDFDKVKYCKTIRVHGKVRSDGRSRDDGVSGYH
jgi:hypothetical protein